MKKLVYLAVFFLPVLASAHQEFPQLKSRITQQAIVHSPMLKTLSKKAMVTVIFTEYQAPAPADSAAGYRKISRRACDGLMLNVDGVIALPKECLSVANNRGPHHFQIQLTNMRKASPYYKTPLSFEADLSVQTDPKYGFLLLYPSLTETSPEIQSAVKETFLFNTKTGQRVGITSRQAAEILPEFEKPRVLQEVNLPSTIPWVD